MRIRAGPSFAPRAMSLIGHLRMVTVDTLEVLFRPRRRLLMQVIHHSAALRAALLSASSPTVRIGLLLLEAERLNTDEP